MQTLNERKKNPEEDRKKKREKSNNNVIHIETERKIRANKIAQSHIVDKEITEANFCDMNEAEKKKKLHVIHS